MEQRTGPIGKRYNKLATDRDPYIQRAVRAAEVTIPALFPRNNASNSDDKSTKNDRLPTPYQSVGSRGLNNLSAKLLLAVLPPNSPFFRLMMDDEVAEEVARIKRVKTEMEKALAKLERKVMREMEKRKVRVKIFEGLKQLLVSGNVLFYVMPSGEVRMWRLDRYVVSRDPAGNLLEIIIREAVDPSTLNEKVRELTGAKVEEASTADKPTPISIYTHVKRTGAAWVVQQEANGVMLPGAGTFPLDKLPYMALRFAKLDGEDYGRGFIEEILGDLLSLEGLTKAIVQGSAAAARLLILVKPNSTTKLRDIQDAPNGAVRNGNAEDITFMSMAKDAKQQDLRVAASTAETIEKRLSLAFLLNTALQRNAERVTAQEIREAAAELDDSLGGLFSALSVDLQLPLVTIYMNVMQKSGKLTALPKGTVEPAIITGLDALGRRSDLDRLLEFTGVIAQFGDQGIGRLKLSNFITRVATATGIDTEELVMTDDEWNQLQQQLQQREMLQQALKSLGPNAVKVLGEQFKQAA